MRASLWLAFFAVGCGARPTSPGAGHGAPRVRTACEPGPLAAGMLSQGVQDGASGTADRMSAQRPESCTPLVPLFPDSQKDKPCRAETEGGVFLFDGAGNLIAPHNFSYTYREDGNVARAEMTDPDFGVTLDIEYAYDRDATLLGTRLSASTTDAAPQIAYEFEDGRLIRERADDGLRNEYLYDGDLLLKIVQLGGGIKPETAIAFEYDGAGRRIAEQHIDAGAMGLRYEYRYLDAVSDRVTEMQVLDATRTPPRFVASTTRTYDNRGRLRTIATTGPARTITLFYCD